MILWAGPDDLEKPKSFVPAEIRTSDRPARILVATPTALRGLYYNTHLTLVGSLKVPSLKCVLTYLLAPWSTVHLQKLTDSQLVKKFPTFYGTRRFITAFTSARHLSLSWASSIQSILPHSTSWRSILIFSSHLPLDLPSGLFPSVYPTKALCTPLIYPMCATCPAHLILDLITRTIFGEQYRSLSSSLCSFLHSPVTSSLLDPNIHLSIPFLLMDTNRLLRAVEVVQLKVTGRRLNGNLQ